MVRALLAGILGLSLGLGASAMDEKKSDAKKEHEAKITKVDTKNNTLTVTMKDKDGKDVEKTFKLEETVRYVDSTGKVAGVDLFKSGDYILVIEEEGKLKEVHQTKKKASDKK
jgi:hypothetical protein